MTSLATMAFLTACPAAPYARRSSAATRPPRSAPTVVRRRTDRVARRRPVVCPAWGDPIEWRECEVLERSAASPTGTLTRIVVDVGEDRAVLHRRGGQYVQLRASLGDGAGEGNDAWSKPAFLALASPPGGGGTWLPAGAPAGAVALLVKATGEASAAADLLCAGATNVTFETSPPDGPGFLVDSAAAHAAAAAKAARADPPAPAPAPFPPVDRVVAFATGSGISPVASLVESGELSAPGGGGRVSAATVFYGVRSADDDVLGAATRARWATDLGVRVVLCVSGGTAVSEDEGGAVVSGRVLDAWRALSAATDGSAAGLAPGAGAAVVLCGQRGG